MRRLKRGDVVEFIQNYKDVVKKGETHLVDKAMYVDGVLQCVYIKGETNYIYFDGGDFEWFCKPYENKNVECKVVYEYLNAKKQMKDYDFEQEVINEIDRKSQIIDKEMEKNKNYDYINPNHYKQGDKEVIEMMVDIWGAEDVAKYCSMNAFKYRMRMGFKPNQPVEQELKKATWYEDKAKELRNEQK
jgi:hypothetical protein